VTEHSKSLSLPVWVSKRNGRLVPFEADKISRALFAATETLGRPDAFTARELTDGILHFLAAEAENSVITAAQISELVIKVVRELSQPALAQAFAEFARRPPQAAPERSESGTSQEASAANVAGGTYDLDTVDPQAAIWRAGSASLREYSLRNVFTRDLLAAQADGLLTLTGLETPLQLAGCILGPPTRMRIVEGIEHALKSAGTFVAVDGPEHSLHGADAAVTYARELAIGLRATGLHAVVNLNSALSPSCADDLGEGPLFANPEPATQSDQCATLARDLLEQIVLDGFADGKVRVDWHVGERDFAGRAEGALQRLARRAVEGNGLAFVFDRTRRPVALAEGLDRRHPAVLLAIGLQLPGLASQPRLRAQPALFLQKLESLAHLALSAAVQKRDFLRRHDTGRPAFLLDRARLVVVPIGLEAVAQDLGQGGLCTSRSGLEFARQIVRRLREVLQKGGRLSGLETCVDSAVEFAMEDLAAQSAQRPALRASGLTSSDPHATPKSQLKAAGSLHAAAEAGTAVVHMPADRPLTAEEVASLLDYAWHQTQVVRLRFISLVHAQRQMMAPWEDKAQR
jgi:hypothetical protein